MNLARNILTTLSARVIVMGLALVSSIVLARALGPEGRGLFALVLLLPELAKSVALLGFEQANAVHAGLEPDRCRALTWQSVVTAMVVGGLVALAAICYVALGAPGLGMTFNGPLWLYALPLALVPPYLLTDYWAAILRGMNRIFLLNLVEVAAKIVSLALILVWVVALGGGVGSAVGVHSTVVVAVVLVLGALLAYSGTLGRPTFDRGLWKRTTRFALPAHCSSVMSYLNYRIDQIIIALLLPPDQLAYYVIATEIAERIWIIPGSIATALLPHLTNSPQRDPALAAVIARHAILWTGTACLVLSAVAGFAVELLYSAAYAPTVAALRSLLPGIFALTVGKVLVAELLARKKILYTLWVSALSCSVNVTANFLLIPRMGIAGAGLASSLSYSVVALAVTLVYLRETGVPWVALVPRPGDVLVYVNLLRRLRAAIAVRLGRPAPATGPSPG
jgi:O-antigen/teichoic acid export membrane protein